MASVILVFVGAFVAAVNAQTCQSPAGQGPCNAGNTCTSTAQTCLVSLNICCLNTQIVGGSTGGTATTAAACVDKLNPATGSSDCPAVSYLCNNPTYFTLMTQQCPKTCGRCSSTSTGTGTGTGTTSCVDLINPSTGSSDCPFRTQYCNNAVYRSLMQVQCPATCGFCTSG